MKAMCGRFAVVVAGVAAGVVGCGPIVVHTTPSPKEAAEAEESAGRRADVLRVAS